MVQESIEYWKIILSLKIQQNYNNERKKKKGNKFSFGPMVEAKLYIRHMQINAKCRWTISS
jgi:hypothetical protein